MTHGPHHGRLDRAEPLANPARVWGDVMRTSRMSLAGMTMVALVGGLGGMALAQDTMEMPVYVTGEESCRLIDDPVCEVSDGIEHCRDAVSDCWNSMSDPRVTGEFKNTFNLDCLTDELGCLYWGTHVLDTPEGGWDCTWSGLEDPHPASGNDGLLYGVCPGTGAYDGLTYIWYHVFGPAYNFGDGTSFHGLIYEGEPPPTD